MAEENLVRRSIETSILITLKGKFKARLLDVGYYKFLVQKVSNCDGAELLYMERTLVLQ